MRGHFSGGLGHVEITPVGSVYHRCGVGFVPTHVVPEAIVGCVNAAGHASDSPLLLQLVIN